ncbi:hypothetical protein B0H12DRAFT_213402 [Mycena haematopus]|nr:hypothetical protein B0H12DRAFT_213402 [Mycena haematopus]
MTFSPTRTVSALTFMIAVVNKMKFGLAIQIKHASRLHPALFKLFAATDSNVLNRDPRGPGHAPREHFVPLQLMVIQLSSLQLPRGELRQRRDRTRSIKSETTRAACIFFFIFVDCSWINWISTISTRFNRGTSVNKRPNSYRLTVSILRVPAGLP